MDELLLGLDMGTTNLKAVLFTPQGELVAQAHRPTVTHTPQPGWATFQPDELWTGILQCIQEVVQQVEPGRIRAVAVASMGESGVLLDAQDQPLYPIIAWYDQRTEVQVHWLTTRLDQDALFARTGLSLLPIATIFKLLWLQEHEPEVIRRAVRWLHVSDYIAYRLSGVQVTEYSLASRTMLFDIHSRTWMVDVCAEIGLKVEWFAPLVGSGTRLGTLLPEVTRLTGLAPDVQVVTGGHDHVCGSFGAGVLTPGAVLDSMGTSETIFLALDKPLTDPLLGRQGYTQGAHVVPGQYYIFGSTYSSGGSLEWFRQACAGGASFETLIEEAAATPAGSRGVCYLPHLQIASAPYDDPQARGAFIGLTSSVGRGELFRAVLEGIAFDARLMLNTLLERSDVAALQRIVAIGGTTRNRLLMHIKAAVMQHTIEAISLQEAACLGVALLAGVGAGLYADHAAAHASIRRDWQAFAPDASLIPVYESRFQQVYRRMYPALKPLHDQLLVAQG